MADSVYHWLIETHPQPGLVPQEADQLSLSKVAPQLPVGDAVEEVRFGILELPDPFHRAVLSWNLPEDGNQSFQVSWRVRNCQGEWSACHGLWTSPHARTNWYCFNLDEFCSEVMCEAVQIVLTVKGALPPQPTPWGFFHLTTSCKQQSAACSQPPPTEHQRAYQHVYQYALPGPRGANGCSPCSLTMVLRKAGIGCDLQEVCQRCYAPAHQRYGIWPMAIQTAWQYGLIGWVEIISSWERVSELLDRGYHLVCSIAFEARTLVNPPYPATRGHLLVLAGISEDGNVVTYDPRLPAEQGAGLIWGWQDFSHAWFGHGGVAYVFKDQQQP